MTNLIINLVIGFCTAALGFLIAFLLLKEKDLFDFDKKKQEAEALLDDNRAEAEKILSETKAKTERSKEYLEEEKRRRELRIKKIEEILQHKQETVNRKEQKNNEMKLRIASMEEETQSRTMSQSRLDKEILDKLSQKTGLIEESLKKEIIDQLQFELEEENKARITKIEESLKENALKTARKILIYTMQRLCSPTSVETRTVLIKVPRDHVKGKIVGKAGQNVEVIEETLDVDVIFNDLPNTISVSAFNLVNRRIAQRTLEKLVNFRNDLTPQIVKKTIEDAKKEVDEELFKLGKDALEKMGINTKNLDKELIKIIGRLQYRTSYGQNIMKHSMEVSWVATMLGSELGLNVNVCKIGGFLHDLGKAIDQNPDVQGAHDFLTKELMEKYGFTEAEVHAAWTHHDSAPQKTPEALIVKAADAVSAGRPGARQESLEKYLERIRALEDTAMTFEGVKRTYAISAGREIRLLVDPDKIPDKDMQPLAQSVAKKIEHDLSYPGKIKVNVIRRTEEIEIAK